MHFLEEVLSALLEDVSLVTCCSIWLILGVPPHSHFDVQEHPLQSTHIIVIRLVDGIEILDLYSIYQTMLAVHDLWARILLKVFLWGQLKADVYVTMFLMHKLSTNG